MNRVTDPAEQQLIIHAANNFYRLYGNVFRELDATQALTLNDVAPVSKAG